MSRIDTATVRVPAPHLNRAKTAKVASFSSEPQDAASGHAQPTNVARTPTRKPVNADLDTSVPAIPKIEVSNQSSGGGEVEPSRKVSSSPPAPTANRQIQNLAVAIGDDFRIDAIAPGYPAPSEDSPIAASSSRSDSGLESGSEEETNAIQTNEAESLPAHHPGVAGPGVAGYGGTKADPDSPVGNRKDKPHANVTVDEEPQVEDLEEVEGVEDVAAEADSESNSEIESRLATDREPKELEAPEVPALADSPERKLTFDEVEQAVRELAKERERTGEIFRLDRPSYSMMQSQSADVEDLSESLSETDFSETQSQEIQTNGFLSKSRMTRAMEEGLRQARARVFNPVWEVDNFQWPDVCGELLEAGHDNMQKVAANLSSACQEGLQVMAVTSPGSGAGTTTVSCCLAMLAGMNGMKVAILDGDLENPTLSLQTNLDVESDWKNALMGHMSLEEIAVHSIDDQVTLLPLIQPIDQSEIASDDDRIYHMMQELTESFDLVIVDAGHIERTRSLINSLGEQGVISAVVTVIDKRHTTQQAVDECIRRIRQTGIASIGLVENFAA